MYHRLALLVALFALAVMQISCLPVPLQARDQQDVDFTPETGAPSASGLFGDYVDDFVPTDSTTASATSTSTSTTSTSTTKTRSTTTAAAATTTDVSSSSSSSSGATHSGRGTWYTPDLGSCGKTNSESDMVVALNEADMANGSNSNSNPKCGKQIDITYGGKSVTATIVDTCPSCPKGALDLSPAVFEQLAKLSVGVIQLQWSYV
ncbi:RlpA-like double-psi beta-barrel-protein domain-containing protein-containing protein [Gongronella butleri]|nr:RlpA-like double-psi beta-barrel-protein domain-containing protein-containing protein [Gongronella butleri]